MSSGTRTRTSASAIRRHHRCSPLPSRHSAPETSRTSHTSSRSTSRNSSPQSAKRNSGNLLRDAYHKIFNSKASLGVPGEALLLKTDFTPLPCDRSGQERTAVGFAEQGRAEADRRRHDGTCTGAAKRMGERGGGPRCTKTGRNEPVDAAKRTRRR